MIRKLFVAVILGVVLLGLGIFSLTNWRSRSLPTPPIAPQPSQATGRVTKYDLATRDDLLFSRLVTPAMSGETSQWSKQLLGGMPAQFGDWIYQLFDASTLANIVTETFSVEGQQALMPVQTLVSEMRGP